MLSLPHASSILPPHGNGLAVSIE
ncbi:MAG: hypothetical protein RLZZ303_3047, partial [Candidatus Hydrogenedentota bacterium]